MTTYTDEQLIAQHMLLKDAKAAAEEAYKAQNANFNRMLQAVEGLLAMRLLAIGGEKPNIRTAAGTAYQRVLTYARVADKDAFKRFVIETILKTGNDDGFIDWGEVVKDRAEKYVADTQGEEPPGIKTTSIRSLVTRR